MFHKYQAAPVQTEAALAERFLKTERLDRMDSAQDPLSLVTPSGSINTAQPALTSVLDHLNQVGQQEGRGLQDVFSRAPYGWSQGDRMRTSL